MRRLPPKKAGSQQKIQNTLVVDGNALYKRGFIGAKNEYNNKGKPIGGVYQFLTVLRKILEDNLYHNVFVFWDGKFSGKLRWEIYKDYKSGRGKDYINGTQPDDPSEIIQRGMVFNYLEELYVRQLVNEVVEGDDFIAYYCKVKKSYENVTIITSDRDLCQLIDDNVRIYMLDLKNYVTKENFNQFFKYHLDNAALIKVLCGDSSDSIKGIRRLGEGTLLKYFPELKERKVELSEIINKAKEMQHERIKTKKKPLQILTNITECLTDGIQGKDLYEINTKLVDLSIPLLTEEAIEEVNFLINSNLSDDRSIKKVYSMLKEDGIDKIIGENRFGDYLLPFKKLIEREKKNNIIK